MSISYIICICWLHLIYALSFIFTLLLLICLPSGKQILLHITSYHKYKHSAPSMLVIFFKTELHSLGSRMKCLVGHQNLFLIPAKLFNVSPTSFLFYSVLNIFQRRHFWTDQKIIFINLFFKTKFKYHLSESSLHFLGGVYSFPSSSV